MGVIAPVTPGEILASDYLAPFGLTADELAKAIGVAPIQISQIIRGQMALSAEIALRLARFFRTDPQYWLNLQDHYDIEIARSRLRSELDDITPLNATDQCD